jgi:hypothetical protein
MRFETVGRVSLAGAALVAMGVGSPFVQSPRRGAGVDLASVSLRRMPEPSSGAQKRKKPQIPEVEIAASAS